jgi:hypothetical protein
MSISEKSSPVIFRKLCNSFTLIMYFFYIVIAELCRVWTFIEYYYAELCRVWTFIEYYYAELCRVWTFIV